MMTISDSIIDIPIASSNGRDNIMLKNRTITPKVYFFSMVSTLPLELAFEASMVPSDIVIRWYYKISKQSKSVGACI